jgi:hypothetical protein
LILTDVSKHSRRMTLQLRVQIVIASWYPLRS